MTRVTDLSIERDGHAFRDLLVLAADTNFFMFFDFPVVQGNRGMCIAHDRIVLSEQTAITLFGHTDVLNEILTVHTTDATLQLVVSAIVGKSAENSHLEFDGLFIRMSSQENGGWV